MVLGSRGVLGRIFGIFCVTGFFTVHSADVYKDSLGFILESMQDGKSLPEIHSDASKSISDDREVSKKEGVDGGVLLEKVNESETVVIPPEVTVPEGLPVVDQEGYLMPESVRSVRVLSDESIQWCSLLARHNLMRLTGLASAPSSIGSKGYVAMGDAIDLVEWGMESKKFVSLSHKSSMVLQELRVMKERLGGSVYDLYVYASYHKERYVQGHRAVLIYASDKHWYVLDPLHGDSVQGLQQVDEYFKELTSRDQVMILNQGYTPSSDLLVDQDTVLEGVYRVPVRQSLTVEYSRIYLEKHISQTLLSFFGENIDSFYRIEKRFLRQKKHPFGILMYRKPIFGN